MRLVALISCVLVACRAPRSPQVANTIEEEPAVARKLRSERTVEAPRFDLDVEDLVPDPSHELRWPLTASNHPQLEPGFPIAAELAQPGVTWLDLCRQGAHRRRVSAANQDRTIYLRAWCFVLAHDVEAAVGELVPLRRSTVRGIARTIWIDIANILVSEADADRAERILAKLRVDEPALFDVLAATFAELGKLDDARTLNARALESNAYADAATRCHRLARHILLGDPTLLEKLDQVAAGNDPECRELASVLHCYVTPANGCAAYFKSTGVDDLTVHLLRAYYQWPMAPAGPAAWLAVAETVKQAIPLELADEYATQALEAALRAAACESDWIPKINAAARKLQNTKGVDTSLAVRLRALIVETDVQCWKR